MEFSLGIRGGHETSKIYYILIVSNFIASVDIHFAKVHFDKALFEFVGFQCEILLRAPLYI